MNKKARLVHTKRRKKTRRIRKSRGIKNIKDKGKTRSRKKIRGKKKTYRQLRRNRDGGDGGGDLEEITASFKVLEEEVRKLTNDTVQNSLIIVTLQKELLDFMTSEREEKEALRDNFLLKITNRLKANNRDINKLVEDTDRIKHDTQSLTMLAGKNEKDIRDLTESVEDISQRVKKEKDWQNTMDDAALY